MNIYNIKQDRTESKELKHLRKSLHYNQIISMFNWTELKDNNKKGIAVEERKKAA